MLDLIQFPRLLHSRFGILSMMLQGFYVKFFEERRKRNRSTSFIHTIDTNKNKGRWCYHFNKWEQTSTMLEQLKKNPIFPFDTEISFRQVEIFEIALTDKKLFKTYKMLQWGRGWSDNAYSRSLKGEHKI